MSIDRRQFLKIAGASALLGLGGLSTSHLLLRNSLEAAQGLTDPSVITDPKALVAKRWGMVVDMSKFKTEEDYKRVMDACHHIHNVPTIGNPKEEIKWIWKETYEHAFPGQEDKFLSEEIKHLPFLVLCNHCENPPCVRVCPTKATFRRPDGIVMMDFHRCIGCRFCMAGCPFGARSFNWKDPRQGLPAKVPNPEFPTRMRGVVEKCTFCAERVDKGKLPACVEA